MLYFDLEVREQIERYCNPENPSYTIIIWSTIGQRVDGNLLFTSEEPLSQQIQELLISQLQMEIEAATHAVHITRKAASNVSHNPN